jgi:hypothetical protein
VRFYLATANITIQSKLPKPIEKLILAPKIGEKVAESGFSRASRQKSYQQSIK